MMDDMSDTPPLPSRQELDRLVRSANGGDEGALTQLRDYLDRWPEIAHRVGDLSQHVQLSLVGAIAGANPLISESITRQLDTLRVELLGDAPTPLERLAVERILACWLHAQQVDVTYPTMTGLSPTTARFVLQLRESSQRRFDAATKSLATLRRLLAATPAETRATLLRVHAGA